MPHSDKQLRSMTAQVRAGVPLSEVVVPPGVPRKVRNNEESRMQQALVRWWSANCAAFAVPEQLLFAIPNGARKGAIIGSILKREGVRKGAPDLMLAVGRTPVFHCTPGDPCKPDRMEHNRGMFLELKTPTGRIEPEQLAFHAALRSQGYRVTVIRTLAEGIDEITSYLTK